MAKVIQAVQKAKELRENGEEDEDAICDCPDCEAERKEAEKADETYARYKTIRESLHKLRQQTGETFSVNEMLASMGYTDCLERDMKETQEKIVKVRDAKTIEENDLTWLSLAITKALDELETPNHIKTQLVRVLAPVTRKLWEYGMQVPSLNK